MAIYCFVTKFRITSSNLFLKTKRQVQYIESNRKYIYIIK